MRAPALAAVLAAAAFVVVPTGASAASRSVSGLHDARYCEIIELKGVPPDTTATVWNTIGPALPAAG